MMTSVDEFSAAMLPVVEKTMQASVQRSALSDPAFAELHDMITYHMGWTGEGAGTGARGKRLRPLILLLTCAAAGGDWTAAVPAAAAVELLHNFSLVHDDIEDKSELRRGRRTAWSLWGTPQAINMGDALFSIAHLSLFDLAVSHSPAVTLEAAITLQKTCLKLTQGQYLDMAFESQSTVSLETYWKMIGGKTAALLAACCDLGALCASTEYHANNPMKRHFRLFGEKLGLAFQAQDDILGIWGNSSQTGKSTSTDLIERKKSLPILYGLHKNGPFAKRWVSDFSPDDIPQLAQMLEGEGALHYSEKITAELTAEANEALRYALEGASSSSQKNAGEVLIQLAQMLLQRQK